MNEWLQPTPFLIFVFMLGCVVFPLWIKRRRDRARIVRPYWGDPIPERDQEQERTEGF